MLIFAGVIAVVLCSTPSVDRKPSRVPAAFAENSTTTGHPLSGHLMTTTALGAFTCPTKIPEAHEDVLNHETVTMAGHHAGQGASSSDLCKISLQIL